VASLLGASAKERPEPAKQASPIVYVDRSDPPVLTLHGTTDATVPISEPRHYKQALDHAGVANLLIEVPTDQHAFSPLATEKLYRSSTCSVLAFLAHNLAR
jgi:dipeptidyl aminopeptidase/acylaminoacyl peptidase